jgi:hypothetical protein
MNLDKKGGGKPVSVAKKNTGTLPKQKPLTMPPSVVTPRKKK